MTHIMAAVPSTISLGNLEYFKEIHSEKKTLLITLLKRLDPYTVFVLANYSRIIQDFNEIHFYHTSKLGYALIFLRLMIEMWKKDHLETISYYYTFMVSFNIRKPRLSIENVLEMSHRQLKLLSRNCSKSTIYFQSL